MKTEVLPDGADDRPLVRMYDFAAAEVARLFDVLSDLASGRQQSIAVNDLLGVEAVAGCRLILHSGSIDRGLVQLSAPTSFDCILTPGSWDNVAGLTEPFVTGAAGYQWLSTSGDAKWLLSRGGQW